MRDTDYWQVDAMTRRVSRRAGCGPGGAPTNDEWVTRESARLTQVLSIEFASLPIAASAVAIPVVCIPCLEVTIAPAIPTRAVEPAAIPTS